MSLFISVRPEVEAIEDLQEALHPIRRLPAAAHVRWTSPDLWHITLGFLGDPDAAVDEDVTDRLRAWSDIRAIGDVRLASAGSFGRQVLWAGVEEGSALERLADLARGIPGLVRGSGAVPDRRTWRPHLTLGRLRRGSPSPLVAALLAYRGPTWSVRHVELVRSSGGPRPHHDVVARIPLLGSAAER